MSEGRDAQPERKESIFEVLDELIFHMNTTKSTFNFLIASSLILAPVTFIVAGVFVFHPRFLPFLLDRVPQVANILFVFIAVAIVLAAIWLGIGLKERMFFARWNKRYSRFMSLKERMDKELGD
jgi:hypothetical protein